MTNITSLTIFENFKIRRVYDEESETWFFSVVDIIQALEVSSDARNRCRKHRNFITPYPICAK